MSLDEWCAEFERLLVAKNVRILQRAPLGEGLYVSLDGYRYMLYLGPGRGAGLIIDEQAMCSWTPAQLAATWNRG